MKNPIRVLILPGAILICALTSVKPVFADHEAAAYYTYGEVIDAEPIIRRTVETIPREQCRPVRHQRVVRPDHHNNYHNKHALPSLFGGLLGGIIGNQFGGGHGKTAFTVAGALAGANLAASSAHRQENHYTGHTIRRRCTLIEEVREVEKIEGYFVTYLYQGRKFTRTTLQHPGSRIRLHVQVNPITDSLAYNAYRPTDTY